MNEKNARGTSICSILPMTITSSFFYYKGNFINWKIAIFCALGGTIGGYIGAKLLRKLPEIVLKIVFVGFIFYASIRMLIS